MTGQARQAEPGQAPPRHGVSRWLAPQADAVLALADGSLWHGQGLGKPGHCAAEVVFNTAMFGYQEILTDPSYRSQAIVFTCAHIGNVGTNPADNESGALQAAGAVFSQVPTRPSNWIADNSLLGYLGEAGLPAMARVDTRALTAHLRENGAMGGCLYQGEAPLTEADWERACEIARNEAPDLGKLCLAREVSAKEPYDIDSAGLAAGLDPLPDKATHIVVYDFGVKRSILRMLRSQSCRVTVAPATTPAAEALALRPDGLLLSNGPGDPRACPELIAIVKDLLASPLPILGICLGHQLLALASGATIHKMKFGHHGSNHPVLDLDSQQVFISSQNHNYAVDPDSLPAGSSLTHRSLFDDSLQGFQLPGRPVFGFQGHPEASPGPRDLDCLFGKFLAEAVAGAGRQGG